MLGPRHYTKNQAKFRIFILQQILTFQCLFLSHIGTKSWNVKTFSLGGNFGKKKKPNKLFSGKVKTFCLTFSNKTKHFSIPEIKMFSCGMLKWPQNALFQVTSVFKLCFPLVLQPSEICSLEVFSLQSPCLDRVSCFMPKDSENPYR